MDQQQDKAYQAEGEQLIKFLLQEDMKIPLSKIDMFWTKLNTTNPTVLEEEEIDVIEHMSLVTEEINSKPPKIKKSQIKKVLSQETLNENGVLILCNRTLGTLYGRPVTSSFPPIPQLLNTNNLEIRDHGRDKTIFWESFDFPTDTLLPDINLGWKPDVELQQFIRFWKSSEDPSDSKHYSWFKMWFMNIVQMQNPMGSV
ncbi:hypothetical protein R6Q59_028213 [Mikania micrantha]